MLMVVPPCHTVGDDAVCVGLDLVIESILLFDLQGRREGDVVDLARLKPHGCKMTMQSDT